MKGSIFCTIISTIFLLQNFPICNGKVSNEGSLKLDLGADGSTEIWVAHGRNGTTHIIIPATVPGGIYSDLEVAGLFDTPIYAYYNDRETRWVGRTDWTFIRQFDVSSDLLARTSVVLVCEGLDTVSSIFINDIKIGESINMFIRYEFDIKSVLKVGSNDIRFEFKSPVLFAQQEQIDHNATYGYPVLPNHLVPEFQGEDLAHMIRKVQASFSWDWGPSYPSSGIYKEIYIEAYDSTVIRDILVFLKPNKEIPDETSTTVWELTTKVYFSGLAPSTSGILTLTSVVSGASTTIQLTRTDEPANIRIMASGSDVKLWWPNGYGEPHLYDYDVKFQSDNGNENSTQRLRVGFRTLELIEDHVDSARPKLGREFYILINGKKMYSKGSNSIPIHVLPEKATNEMAYWLLLSAKQTHTNVIRVWGGGIYYQDEFYDRADELGILIWQDFMFACAMYPATPHFLETVREEVRTQVKRLQHHPSLAIWATNNENEGALRDNWYGTASNFEVYKADYIKLYVDTVIHEVKLLDDSRKCIPSSPTNGIQSEEEGWVAAWPADWIYGDTHPYDYYSNSWDWTVFRQTRYASEFGYQSFPHISSLVKVMQAQDMHWHSNMMYHRQHHPLGQGEIPDLINMHLPLPVNYNTSEFFPFMLYLAQVEQSVAQKTQAESYRRLSDKLDENTGWGHNMGALYWQLNDIWPGASWASIEIDGRWKMLHYYAKNFLAPVLASPFIANDTSGDVIVEIISDATENYNGLLNVQLFRLNSFIPFYSVDVAIQAVPLTSRSWHRISKSTIDSCQASGVPCFVYTKLARTPDNFLFLNYPKNTDFLEYPKLRVTDITVSEDGKLFELILESDALAPFVFVNLVKHTHGWFSENGFIMITPTKTLTYVSSTALTLDEFKEQLEVVSLHDVARFM